MWGTSWRQRLRLAPLSLAAAVADRVASTALPHRESRIGPWPAGIAVIVPERDAPDLLREALLKLREALQPVREPTQVIVAANGAPRERYDAVAREFPDVEWEHSDVPLGFAGAIERGLARVRLGGTYLLNNDMALEAEAIAPLLPLRGERVFAIGSQILQFDATGRRQETGFTDWYVDDGGLRLYHAPVPGEVAKHLCASGGAALFRTSLLARYLPASRAYDPFYWEDVEWGLRAWRDGFDVLFCPQSRAAHRHRATTSRFYAPDELARIVERNRLLFDARHGASGEGADALMQRVCNLPYPSQRELASADCAKGVLAHRWRARRAPQPLPPPRIGGDARIASSYSFRLRERRPAAKSALFVAPFAVFPPRHGGARRVAELIRGLKRDVDVALAGDEATLYDARSFADFDGLRSVRLVQRRDDDAPDASDLAARARAHCHPALADAVRAAVAEDPRAAVVVQHAELVPLVRQRTGAGRWILDLHDAFTRDDFASDEDHATFIRDLAQYDAVCVCSPEDATLVAHARVVTIANGADVRAVDYVPSQGARLLFVGPFRYAPNRAGIARFLADAWPHVRRAVPDATLTVLGGDESLAIARDDAAFAQPGVEVLGHRDDVPRLLAGCALAINPLANIRGSAVKLVETLAAGRACVTTSDGARGFAGSAPGIVIVPDVAAMAEPIVSLLRDAARRHAIERTDAARLDAFGWHHSVARLRELIEIG
ncbi:MAG: glycosyltransferase [Burkholderiales bacterium]